MNLYKYKLLQYYSSKEYDVYNNPIIANGFNNDIGKSCLKIKIPQHILGSDVSDDDLDYLSYNINIQSDGLNDYTFYAIGTPTVGGSSSAWTRYNYKNGIDIKIGSQHADTIIYIISDSSNNQSYLYPINISYKYNISNDDISNLSSNIQSKWKAYFPWEFHKDKNKIVSSRTLYFNDGSTKDLGKYISFETFKNKDYGYSIGTNLYTSIQVFGQYESLNYILRKMPDDDNLYDYSGRHITFNGTNITNINGLSIDINQYYDKESYNLNDASWFDPVFENSCITSLPYLGTVHNYISASSDGKTTIINNNYSLDNGKLLRYGRGSYGFKEPGLAAAFQNCDLLSIGSDKAFPLPWYGDMKTTENNTEYYMNQLTMGSGTFSGCFYECENLNSIYLKFYNFTNIPTSELTNDEHINLAFYSDYNKTSTELPGINTYQNYSPSVNSIDRVLNCFNDSGFNKIDINTYKDTIDVTLIDFPVPIKTYNVGNGYTYYNPDSPAWKTYYNYLCNLTYSNLGNGARYATPSLNFIYKDNNGNVKRTNFITNYKPASFISVGNEIKYWLLYLELYFDFNQNNFEVDYTQPIDYTRFTEFNIIIPNIADLKYTYTNNGATYNSDISGRLNRSKWDYLIESKIINITINGNKYYLTTKTINAVDKNNGNITLNILGFNINNKFYALNTNLFSNGNTTPAGYDIDFERLKANCDNYITISDNSTVTSTYYVVKTSEGYKANTDIDRTPYIFDSNGISKFGCTCID